VCLVATSRETRKFSASEAKAEIVRLIGQGRSAADACRVVGKSRATFDYYRRTDDEFHKAVERQRLLIARGKGTVDETPVPDFPEFCEKYLGQKLFPHQLQWFDLLEGRPPRDIHPSMTYNPGDPDLLVVNTPPGHAKSTTITVNYVVWRIVKDPQVRVVIVSKTQRLAIQFLLQIRNRLTHPAYTDLQRDFAPPGGFDADSASWKQDLIYVNANVQSGEAKDPTVQAIGIGGQLYGARADLIVVDDAVDNANAHDFEKQVQWMQTEVASRLPDGGKILVVGTRMAPRDLYRELLNPDRYHGDDESPWTYFSQPAVLETADDPDRWLTLWPRTDAPSGKHLTPGEDGLYEKWSGSILAKRRARMTPTAWARVYQQEQVAADTVFKPEDVRACQANRRAGLIPDDPSAGRNGGMEGLKLIAGLDPASVGYTAAVLLGVEISTGKRFVIDVHNEASMTPDALRQLIKDWTVKYGIHEWRIERNAFQAFLTRDREVNEFLATRGVILTEHTTQSNKHDPLFGVMAMAGLFTTGIIELPNSTTEGVKALVEQLCTWSPDASKHQKTDCVMALWFAELRALELVQRVERGRMFRDSPFLTRGDMGERWIRRGDSIESPGEKYTGHGVQLWAK
jgi:hypothetical protein